MMWCDIWRQLIPFNYSLLFLFTTIGPTDRQSLSKDIITNVSMVYNIDYIRVISFDKV